MWRHQIDVTFIAQTDVFYLHRLKYKLFAQLKGSPRAHTRGVVLSVLKVIHYHCELLIYLNATNRSLLVTYLFKCNKHHIKVLITD